MTALRAPLLRSAARRLAAKKAANDYAKRVGEAYSAGLKKAMDDRTQFVAAPNSRDGKPFMLNTEPERDYVRMLVHPQLNNVFNPMRPEESMYWLPRDGMEFVFRANRKGYQLPNGGLVLWWDWELHR